MVLDPGQPRQERHPAIEAAGWRDSIRTSTIFYFESLLLHCSPCNRAPYTLLASRTGAEQSDRGTGREQSTERSRPPRLARQDDGHLQSKKCSQKNEACAQSADLCDGRGGNVPMAILKGKQPVRIELNPASGESYGSTEDDECPIQKGHENLGCEGNRLRG